MSDAGVCQACGQESFICYSCEVQDEELKDAVYGDEIDESSHFVIGYRELFWGLLLGGVIISWSCLGLLWWAR